MYEKTWVRIASSVLALRKHTATKVTAQSASRLEAMRTQGRFLLFQGAAT